LHIGVKKHIARKFDKLPKNTYRHRKAEGDQRQKQGGEGKAALFVFAEYVIFI
jgi:hypothetical protein